VSVVRDGKPDAVVIDAMFSAGLDVAPRFGVPTGVIVHTFARRTFEMWRGNLAMQSQGREKAGFGKLAPVEQLWGDRDLVHANTLDALDAGGPVPLTNLRHGAPRAGVRRGRIRVGKDAPLVRPLGCRSSCPPTRTRSASS
jgi:hypothetical protein